MHQPGCQIAAIADIHLQERIFALVESVQTPFRSGWMQMTHALPGQSLGAPRYNQRQPFHHVPFVLRQAACLQPKDSGGKRAVDGRLGLLIVHSYHSQDALPLA